MTRASPAAPRLPPLPGDPGVRGGDRDGDLTPAGDTALPPAPIGVPTIAACRAAPSASAPASINTSKTQSAPGKGPGGGGGGEGEGEGVRVRCWVLGRENRKGLVARDWRVGNTTSAAADASLAAAAISSSQRSVGVTWGGRGGGWGGVD